MTERLTQEQSELVEHNVRLVNHIVKKFSDTRIQKSEFVSAGYFGLIKAAKTFDPEKGARFSTYAGRCITNSILDLLSYVGRNHGRYASLDDVTSKRFFNYGSHKAVAPQSIMDIYDDGMRIEESVVQKTEIEERKLIIGLYLLNKSPRFAQIIRLRLQEGKTHEMIAQDIGISKSYISRILTRIEKDLTAFKRKIDESDGQYYKWYSASDLERARMVLSDPSDWIVHIERKAALKNKGTLSVNLVPKGIQFSPELLDDTFDRVGVSFARSRDSEGVLVFRQQSDSQYTIKDAQIESNDLVQWLSSQGIIPRRYTTCYFDDVERTLYVKVECGGVES